MCIYGGDDVDDRKKVTTGVILLSYLTNHSQMDNSTPFGPKLRMSDDGSFSLEDPGSPARILRTGTTRLRFVEDSVTPGVVFSNCLCLPVVELWCRRKWVSEDTGSLDQTLVTGSVRRGSGRDPLRRTQFVGQTNDRRRRNLRQ